MSNIFEIIDSLGLPQKDSNKLQAYFIRHNEERTVLYSALKSSRKTEEDRVCLLTELLKNISAGMLKIKISAVILFATLRLNFFFVLYHVPVNLDEHQGKPLRRNDWSTRT